MSSSQQDEEHCVGMVGMSSVPAGCHDPAIDGYPPTYKPFPKIQSKHSLVAKHVTEPRWQKLAYHKTKTSGFTLEKAIACAVQFPDQHCGIYAGDEDSYKDFAEVFDPIIMEYHGLKKDFKHSSDMDDSKIIGQINPDAPVHSTRIRVGRSIEGYGLSPGITKQQRIDVEKLMRNAFGNLKDDLSGNYYPLKGMNEDVRQQLVDDHFLFISGDKNLIAAGMERDWPEGRGIFHNKEKTFLTWVNEEDQLRIISMQKGGDVKAVFGRLSRGIEEIKNSVKNESGRGFQYSEKFGYVHSCPTNLGTGMRASVHIDLPGWTAEGVDKLKKRCEELNVQPRGTRGESGGQTGCTFDISNKHRLGYTEVELVQTMIDSVNTLYEEDLKFQEKHSNKAEFPEIQSKHSLVAKHVTEEKWNRLAGIKTKTSGFTLAKAIACAVNFDDQHCGIYAGDEDSYNDFAEVFDPIILEYHGLKPGFKHSSDMDYNKINGKINPNAPVHSTRIRVGRSIQGFGLSPGITKEQRVGVENLMKNAFKKLQGELSGKYYPLTGMEEKTRQQLVDDHFLFISGDKNLIAAGMERDWPEGRGIFHNDDKTFLTWVNEEDQLRIISMEKGGDVTNVFTRLAHGIKGIQDSVKGESGRDFQLSDKFGYLHSCPTNLGTGMRASVHIDLPGWTAEGVDKLKKRCEELRVQPRGTRGESGGQTGCTFDISNKHRLGYTEVELVQTMIDSVNTLYEEDLKYQEKHTVGTFAPFPEIKSKHSLVAKHVTEDKWRKLHRIETATSRFTLAKAIACAVQFEDQHCGIYAGDEDSYSDFADVFDPIICEYHGLPSDFKHTSDMDASKINGTIDANAPVHSTRIRVGRSIMGYGLSPGITKEQRLGVERLMKSAFGKLEGELSGNYYPLLGMNEETRQQLVDDHFLFISGDKNLIAAGMERDWPEGRGIFHNDDKTFLTWVNEEDQLRIISMEKGGDVTNVFTRLAHGIKGIQDSVKGESGRDFQLSDKFGYLHSCPTNLGTGMRASVHIDLPGWTAEGVDKLKKRCEELRVQPRGTRGESGGQTGCTFDISNKHRLGYTEVELVQTMIDSVNTLYEEDLKYQEKHTVGTFAPFPEIKSKHSLVAKHVTEDKWRKLHRIETATSRFTLAKAIACAVQFEDQHCGIYAGDEDSYSDFADVFDPIICEYHGLPSDFKHTSDMDASKINGTIDANAPVHSTRIRVGRSIMGYGLSPGITKEQRLGVERLMKSAFGKLEGELSGNYYPLLGMNEETRQQLVDDHFLFISGDKNLIAAGMERDWPEGRGIFHNDDKTFLTWVNEEDQLRIISMQKGGDVSAVFGRLANGIKAIQDSVKSESGRDFQLSDKFGYLHSCPTNLGTGMRASVHIDLPGWTAEGVDKLKKRCEELSVQPRGTRGESGGQTGCTFDISNKHRLGYTEVQLVQTMIDSVNTLYKEDLEFQKKHNVTA